MDINRDINPALTVDTHRSGRFRFQVGVDMVALTPLMDRVMDAHRRFSSVPILPELAQRLEEEVVVSSVFGTNTIEGGTLSLDETAEVLHRAEGVPLVHDEKERRVLNIRNAYAVAEDVVAKLAADNLHLDGVQGIPIPVTEDLMMQVHRIITSDLSHPYNQPGTYRNNQKGQATKVGDAGHGGVYTPPKCLADIQMLMQAFAGWINGDALMQSNVLIRAPLCHYYFERIHPFWDGNGRVGRVLEAVILRAGGFRYAPFALARAYFNEIDRYFTVFNTARRAEEQGDPLPNTHFVQFFLQCMLEVFDRLHDRVNELIGIMLYENRINDLLQTRTLNARQHLIVSSLLSRGREHDLTRIQSDAWFKALYHRLTRRTQDRDLRLLVDLQLIELRPGRIIRLRVPGKPSPEARRITAPLFARR